MSDKIFQVSPKIGDLEKKYVNDVLESGWITESKYTEKLVDKVKDLTGSKYAYPAPNGTLALYLSLLALDLPKGSDVLVPSFTFMASASSVVFAGHRPVFFDVEDDTWHGDLSSAENAITPKTKAIMPVHMYGSAMNMPNVLAFSKKHKLKVIEDAAQAVGVRQSGRHMGTFGDISIFSFFADKTVTMGEGAFIVTNDDEISEKIKLLRNQGRPNSGTFIHPALGMNFRITEMQAAMGLAQLENLDDIAFRKRHNYFRYATILSTIPDIHAQSIPADVEFIPFRFAFTSSNMFLYKAALEKEGVQTRSFFYPLDKQPCMIGVSSSVDCPVSESLFNNGLALPVHLDLVDSDIDFICSIIIATAEGINDRNT
jgi:perosamine synthetase